MIPTGIPTPRPMSLAVALVPPEVFADELAVATAGAVVVTIFVVMVALEATVDAALDVEAGSVVNGTATPRPKTSELLLQSHPPKP